MSVAIVIWLAIIVFQLLRIEHHLAVIRMHAEQRAANSSYSRPRDAA
jgi:hypothetical protein